jgi:hypothetical protein
MRFVNILAMISATISLGLLSISTSSATDTVVVTGKKCTQGWDCISTTPNDPPPPDGGPGDLGGGGGAGGTPTLTAIGNALRDAAQRFVPTCATPGLTAQQHAAIQVSGCVAQALAEVSAAMGIAASAISADSARTSCTTEVALKIAGDECTR